MVINMEDGKIPNEILDELKLKKMQWERMRAKSGLDKMTQKDRITQLEMAQAELSHRVEVLRSAVLRLAWVLLAVGGLSLVSTAIKIFAH
jgi:hypothetical protein